jgi:cytochrome b subunit of formate dehydrogenase
MAISVLVLMGTAYLPIFNIDFSWVKPHWISGVVLTIAVVIHILKSLPLSRLKNMWFGLRDIKDTFATLGWFVRLKESAPRPGKYSPAQKLIHHAFAVVVLTAVVTGLLMLFKVDNPFVERDPYYFSSAVWSTIYVLHGAASLFLVTMIMLHIYFGLRPEKKQYLRSMFKGWISKDEYEQYHDTERWKQP